MGEILFILATWTAAAGFLLSAFLSPSLVLWLWTAYASFMALFALAHAREKRCGTAGSVVLTCGLLVLLFRELYLQLADRDHVLVPANWMAGFYLIGIGLDLLCALFLVATIYWLASSRHVRNDRNA